jgi:hypothetical protein
MRAFGVRLGVHSPALACCNVGPGIDERIVGEGAGHDREGHAGAARQRGELTTRRTTIRRRLAGFSRSLPSRSRTARPVTVVRLSRRSTTSGHLVSGV